MKLTTVNDTWFKAKPVVSEKLGNSEKVLTKARQTFELKDCEINGNYIEIELSKPVQDRSVWHVWAPDVNIEETEHAGQPEVEIITNLNRDKKDRGPKVYIAGLGDRYLYEPISDKAPSFMTYELTKNGTRLGHNDSVGPGMVRIAEALQPWRDKVGEPFILTSGYRNPSANRACGGASQSRHLSGDAVDGYFPSMNKWEMWNLFHPHWKGGLGIYAHNQIAHLDARGYYSRWGK